MFIKVALPVPPYYSLDYSITVQEVELFDRVLVQVGKRYVIGFVTAKNIEVDYDTKKIKQILKILDKPISKDIASLILWISQYYCCDIYSAIRLALPNDYLNKQEIKPQQDIYVYLDKLKLKESRLTLKQRQLVDTFIDIQSLKLEDLKQSGSSYVINKLFEKDIFKKEYKLKKTLLAIKPDNLKDLNSDQEQALDHILSKSGFNVSLLYGVTGSGKTEVYLQAIKKFLMLSKQVLILIPEINLTPQTVQRFEQRFPDKQIVSLHSKLSDKARLTNWLKVKQGSADIVISTRSGVLADFKNLAIIIVDEEHDISFKQQTSTIRYNARDIAIFRASQLNIPIVLGSATPSIQSYYNALIGKYSLLKLNKRALNNHKNKVELLDLKNSKVDTGISTRLFDLLEKNIISHQQSLIFINKLGFAKALVCNSCGEAVECQKCDKPYTLHTQPYQYLECHFCGTRKPLITSCPSCKAEQLFAYGVGTEKIQSRIEAKFPYNKVVRFDRSNIKTITDLHSVNKMINDHQVDIVVGTQMIAKGHHFADITLIGLINIDSGLYSTDFNAIERTAQMITQVSGRAGRADKPGVVILQTYQPENKLLQLLIENDYLDFLDYLLEQRKYANYPPYSYQAQIIVESKKEYKIIDLLNNIHAKLSNYQAIKISLPLPALHLKRNNIFRYSLIVTADRRNQINSLINYVKKEFCTDIDNSLKIYFDIDPVELL